MEVSRILAEIDAQIEKLQQARALLAGEAAATKTKRSPGRPKKVASTATAKSAGKKRQLSPEARKRIADAQKRRWAESRKSAS